MDFRRSDVTEEGYVSKEGVSFSPLQSTVAVVESIKTVMEMVERLWLWRESFAEKTHEHLKQYFETCQAAYRGLTQPDSEDKRVRSAVLARDDDLARQLKTFPNWSAAQQQVQHQNDLSSSPTQQVH
jgi:exocyst complex component 4